MRIHIKQKNVPKFQKRFYGHIGLELNESLKAYIMFYQNWGIKIKRKMKRAFL